MDREGPRRPHHRFKWLAISDALVEPVAFAATYSAADRQQRIEALWDDANREYPDDEHVASAGLSIESHGDPLSPVIFINFPTPARPNEAYTLAMIPTVSSATTFRVFALEKAVFPPTGDPLVFVVEIRATARDNFGPPSDDAANDPSRGRFVTAILEICDGKRKPLGSVPFTLPSR